MLKTISGSSLYRVIFKFPNSKTNHISQGFGPPSEPLTVTTGEDVPEGAPLELQSNAWSSTQINLVWRTPARSTVHGKVTGYMIEYGVVGQKSRSVLG